jgi:steroid delta-isomerase-like uncharacterized protein
MKKLFMILPLALILCFMVGCQNKAAMAELEDFKAQAALEEQNEAIFRHFTEELNKGNIEYFRETFAPDFENYDPSGITEPQSLEEVIEQFKMVFKGFPDMNQAIQEVVAKGDKIIARSIFTGTHTGEYFGIPATGKKIRFSCIEIWTMEDGKCVELRTDYDRLGMMQQLGFELKPKEGE